MEFWEHKTELSWTDVVVNLIDDDVWEAEDELTGAFNDGVESWD